MSQETPDHASHFAPVPSAQSASGRTHRTVLLVLNYKKCSDSVNFLQSVMDTGLDDVDIVILDNASGNDSVLEIQAWIEANFPDSCTPLLEPDAFRLTEPRFAGTVRPEYVKGRVALFSSAENFGFSGGNNALAHIGRQLGHEFLYLLNSDILFTDRFAVRKLEDLHDADPQAYLSGPAVINMDGSFDSPFRRDSFWGDAVYYGPINWIRRKFGLPIVQLDVTALSKPEGAEVYKVSGAAMFFPTDRFFQLNGLDENVWLSCEEVILSEKILRNGGKIMYLPTTVLLHFKSSAPRSTTIRAELLSNHFKNRNYYYREYRRYGPLKMFILRCVQTFRIVLSKHLQDRLFRSS